jgi:hypothetical protein
MLASQSDLCSNFADCPVCQDRIARAGGSVQCSVFSVQTGGRRLVGFARAKQEIEDGDVLLWRPTNALGLAIAAVTGSQYSHAAMAAWLPERRCIDGQSVRGNLMSLEMLPFRGGRMGNLEKQVRRWPGRCDVYRPRGSYNNHEAMAQMIRLVQQDYGWIDYGCVVLHRYLGLPTVDLENSDDPEVPRDCSAGVAWACRTGGDKEVYRGDRDADIVPGDLANEEFSAYRLTLIP